MSLTLKCATDSRDELVCEVGEISGNYIVSGYEDGEHQKTVTLNLEDAKRLENQVFQYLHEPFEPSDDIGQYEIYWCATGNKDRFEAENLTDRDDREVLALDFNTYTFNLNSETAKLLLEDLRNFILEAN
ncbi:hypothetical protein [Bacillus phage DZ1]|uniref:Uncharacterized protein n=1 Tax=Bacillus phage DZ1 TaxID=3075862 RepID=A0AA96ELB8_9CAUD|nr:hypothetical protein [Bacillus phage DZ1]